MIDMGGDATAGVCVCVCMHVCYLRIYLSLCVLFVCVYCVCLCVLCVCVCECVCVCVRERERACIYLSIRHVKANVEEALIPAGVCVCVRVDGLHCALPYAGEREVGKSPLQVHSPKP